MIMQVHRFGDKTAVCIGHGYTVYLDTDTAVQLAEAIIAVVDEIEIEPEFSESTVGTFTIEQST